MDRITLAFVGDIMIGRTMNEPLRSGMSIWGDVMSVLLSADFRIGNLEAALTKSNVVVPKVFNFKSDPEHVACLQSFDVLNLANNHVLDYSVDGLIDTLNTLDDAGIMHVGAGRTLAAAKKTASFQKKGIRCVVMGCTDNEPGWLAGKEKPGTHYVEVGDQRLFEDIKRAKKEGDTLILTIHWGPNMREWPTREFIAYAHQLIDAGVDILHGHSAHNFQGVEIYRDKLIMYDTGDFVDDYMVDPYLRNDRTFIFLVEVSKAAVCSLRMIPVRISDLQVNLAKGADAEETIERMIRLSTPFHTSFEAGKNELVVRLGKK